MATSGAGQKASQFLSQIGNAGGPIGAMISPGLLTFGATDLANQLNYGLTDNYAMQRSQAANTTVGSPQGGGKAAPMAMPADLASNYLNLALPGSPLPTQGLLLAHNLRAAQKTQDSITAMDQQMYAQMMPPTGMLPMSPYEQAVGAAKKLHSKSNKKSGGRR